MAISLTKMQTASNPLLVRQVICRQQLHLQAKLFESRAFLQRKLVHVFAHCEL